MKKIFLLTILLSFTASTAQAFEYLTPINPVSRNFSAINQHRFEKQETLDFVNNPTQYKEKREKIDIYNDYREGKTNEIPAQLKPQIKVNPGLNSTPAMQFIKDENGQLKIQSF